LRGPMSVSRRVCLSALVVLCVACAPADGATEPPAGFPHSAATRSCGPADGPAVTIYLASAPVQSLEPAAPYVGVYVWQPLDRLAGRSWSVAGGESEGSAWFRRSPNDSEVAADGRVTVGSVAPDNTIEGWVDLRFAKAGQLRGTFRARWIPGNPLCG
jgi:hypothetical protein